MDLLFDVRHGTVVLGLMLSALMVAELCYRLGRRIHGRHKSDTSGVVDTVHAASLGLAGLLFGFTFAMSAARFENRKQLVLEEANAIGTAHLRAALVIEPHSGELQRILKEYVDNRLEFFNAANDIARLDACETGASAMHARMWTQIGALSKDDPRSYPNLLMTTSINDVIDLAEKRIIALHNQVPWVIWMLLSISVIMGSAVMGLRCGLSQRRLMGVTAFFVVLMCLTLYVIMDLDQPRRGVIRVSQEAMLDLRHSLKQGAASAK
jgi:uncharacterized membrane protein (Fun14 family)